MGSHFAGLINSFLFNAESVQQMALYSKIELALKFVTRAQIYMSSRQQRKFDYYQAKPYDIFTYSLTPYLICLRVWLIKGQKI